MEKKFLLKKRYALDFYAICDSSIRFIYILVGWSNFQHHTQIYFSTDLQRYLKNYFAFGKYFLGNAAYINFSHLITLYKSLFINKKKNWHFNQKLFQICVDIKHAFEILKGSLRNLTELKFLFYLKKSYKFIVM